MGKRERCSRGSSPEDLETFVCFFKRINFRDKDFFNVLRECIYQCLYKSITNSSTNLLFWFLLSKISFASICSKEVLDSILCDIFNIYADFATISNI